MRRGSFILFINTFNSSLIFCLFYYIENRLDVISTETTPLAILGEDHDTAVLSDDMDLPTTSGLTQQSVSGGTSSKIYTHIHTLYYSYL